MEDVQRDSKFAEDTMSFLLLRFGRPGGALARLTYSSMIAIEIHLDSCKARHPQ